MRGALCAGAEGRAYSIRVGGMRAWGGRRFRGGRVWNRAASFGSVRRFSDGAWYDVPDIFISYSYSKQRPPLTRDLAAYLEREGFSVWWDANLTAGETFGQVLRRELRAARAVIAIWTADSVKSRWVQAEAEFADTDGKLIPLRTRDLDIRQIPLPYNTYHTDLVDDRAAILKAARHCRCSDELDEDRPRLADGARRLSGSRL
jgi:hypothetical protein